MPFDFTIAIVGPPGGLADFVPQGGNAGDPLIMKAGDIVSWDNQTDDIHQPWPADAKGNPLPDSVVGKSGKPNYLSDEIEPGESSRPAWVGKSPIKPVPGGSMIYYCCKRHPQEVGRIEIVT